MALATLDELKARLDWELDTSEESVATSALEDLSDDALFYGSANWTETTVPRQAKSLLLRAAARYMRNPDGYIQSRAGDETLVWSDQGEDSGTAYFSEREQKLLNQIAGRNVGLVSVQLQAHGPARRRGPRYIDPTTKELYNYDAGYVPIVAEGYAGIPDPFPFYADDDGSY